MMADWDGEFDDGDGCIVCGPHNDCECEDGPVSTDYDDEDDEPDSVDEYEDERQANVGTSQCDGTCQPQCNWCLVSHRCPEECAGGPCPYESMKAKDKLMSTEIPTDILAFVAEVEARANKATPGPWSNCGASDGRCQCGLVWSNELDAGVLSTIAEDEQTNSSFSHDQRCDNAIFAANARTDVPALIAIVREQAARIAKLEAGRLHVERETLLDLLVRMGNHVYITGGDAEALSLEDIHQEIFKFQNELTNHKTAGLEERIAKLESLGPWIEEQRVAELEAATLAGMDDNDDSRIMHEARANTFQRVGLELNNHAEKDLRKP